MPVPILDLNKTYMQNYMKSNQIPYIALNEETYISLKHKELRKCKIRVINFIVKNSLFLDISQNTDVKVQYLSM